MEIKGIISVRYLFTNKQKHCGGRELSALQTSQSLQLFSTRAVYFVDEVMLSVNERKASDSILFPCTIRLVGTGLALNNTHAWN
jgi:hypothetical protein